MRNREWKRRSEIIRVWLIGYRPIWNANKTRIWQRLVSKPKSNVRTMNSKINAIDMTSRSEWWRSSYKICNSRPKISHVAKNSKNRTLFTYRLRIIYSSKSYLTKKLNIKIRSRCLKMKVSIRLRLWGLRISIWALSCKTWASSCKSTSLAHFNLSTSQLIMRTESKTYYQS